MTTTYTPLRARDHAERPSRRPSALSTLACVAVGTGAMAVSALAVGLGVLAQN
ncbi:hypothetical protein [Agreia sp. Leaf283]|uniref:hypothetical protein n=1 Tax=Agreia sp. Leaf283 TaxID=1736321 RepID=UPI000AAE54F6|nr:hypothetical protein [Agreia sp. Leaf283]